MDNYKNYNESSNVCKKVYNYIKSIASSEGKVGDVLKKGNEFLKRATKEKSEFKIAIPICISLNNCVGYENDLERIIKLNDIINVEIGISYDGCIVILCETFCIGKDIKYTKILNSLQKNILKTIKNGETNDEVKILLESKCTDKGVFPIENCISYEQFPNILNSYESKYIVLNYKKYYDEDDNLVVENDCFEFEKGETYTINLSIVDTSKECDGITEEIGKGVIYRFNENRYNLRLNCAREFLSKIKKKHNEYAFDISEYNSAREKMGIKECYDNNILEVYPKMYVKNSNVYTKKFTIMVGENESILL